MKKKNGLTLNWIDGAIIDVIQHGDGICIRANPEGLRSLANHMLTLADPDTPEYAHLHLDDSNGLEDGSKELLLEKKNSP